MAGAPGFEPGYDGIKIRCLTAWRRPNNLNIISKRQENKIHYSLSGCIGTQTHQFVNWIEANIYKKSIKTVKITQIDCILYIYVLSNHSQQNWLIFINHL